MFVIMVLIQFAMYLQVEQLTSFEMRDTHTPKPNGNGINDQKTREYRPKIYTDHVCHMKCVLNRYSYLEHLFVSVTALFLDWCATQTAE